MPPFLRNICTMLFCPLRHAFKKSCYCPYDYQLYFNKNFHKSFIVLFPLQYPRAIFPRCSRRSRPECRSLSQGQLLSPSLSSWLRYNATGYSPFVLGVYICPGSKQDFKYLRIFFCADCVHHMDMIVETCDTGNIPFQKHPP